MFLLLLYRFDLLLDDLVDNIAAFEVILLGVSYISKSVVAGSTCQEAVAASCLFNVDIQCQQFEVNFRH